MNHLIDALELKGLQANQWLEKKLQGLNNNRGSGIIEYIALAAVVIAICGIVAGKATDIGSAVSTKLTDIIAAIKVGG